MTPLANQTSVPTEADPDALRTALNGVVARSVRPVALGISVLYALYVPSHFFLLPSPANYVMAGSALLSLLAALVAWRRGHRVRPASAHAVIALLGLILLANSLLHIYVVAQPEQATNLLLVIVGLGSIMLSVWWLLGTVALALVGWAGVMAQLGAWDEAIHYGFALASATAVSLVVQYVRRRTLQRLEHLRVRDRDQRRRLEQSVSELAHSEERFRRFAEASFEGMLLHDDGRILDVNQRLATMLGYTPAALQSASIDTLFDASTDTAMIRHETSVETPHELLARCANGHTVAVEFVQRTVPFRGHDAQIAAIRDISNHKAQQAQLRAYQRDLEATNRQLERANKMKSAFLANMSHELRTPLTAVIGFSEVLGDELFGDLNETQQQYVGNIHRSGQHLLALINDILDLSKIEADKMTLQRRDTDLVALAKDALDLFRDRAEHREIRVNFQNTLETPTVWVDPVRIRQVLYNYLSNAFKFTPDGGEVGLELHPAPGAVHVCVSDTGIGIAAADLEKLFKPFSQVDDAYTRQFEGTGLGLALTKRLVELHGGKVWVESTPNEGSVFGFSLPVAPPPTSVQRPPSA